MEEEEEAMLLEQELGNSKYDRYSRQRSEEPKALTLSESNDPKASITTNDSGVCLCGKSALRRFGESLSLFGLSALFGLQKILVNSPEWKTGDASGLNW